MVFYLASVVLSLYAAYLFTFRTYDTDYDGKPTERIVCQNIVYILTLVIVFLPLVNIVFVAFAAIFASLSVAANDIYIDSWLFRKPKQEKEN